MIHPSTVTHGTRSLSLRQHKTTTLSSHQFSSEPPAREGHSLPGCLCPGPVPSQCPAQLSGTRRGLPERPLEGVVCQICS